MGEDTKALGRLLDRMNSRKSPIPPITPDQVRSFTDYPDGPLMPSDCTCVSAERLSMFIQGQLNEIAEDKQLLRMDWLALSPRGERCFCLSEEFESHVFLGDEKLLTFSQIEDTEMHIDFIGFQEIDLPSKALPIVRVYYTIDKPKKDKESIPGPRVFEGREQILTDRNVMAISIDKNGNLIFCVFNNDGDRSFTFYHGQDEIARISDIFYEGYLPVDFFQTLDGRIICGLRYGIDLCAVFLDEVAEGIQPFCVDQHTNRLNIHFALGCLRFVKSRYDRSGLYQYNPPRNILEFSKELGFFKYASQYRDVGRTCYIGRRHPSADPRWIVDGQVQPKFECVSHLFEKDGKWMYHAYRDGYFYLMEIPD